MADEDPDRPPAGRRRERVIAAALIVLAMVAATVSVVLRGAYWLAFLALLIGLAGVAYTSRNP